MFKRQKGFTLFEMLVVIAIIAIISILVLANYRQGQKTYALEQSAQKLVSDIRQVQGMAISGYKAPNFTTIGGYGVRIIDGNSYKIFLYNGSNPDGCPSGAESDLGTFNFSTGVSIKEVKIYKGGSYTSYTGVAINGKHVFFRPPSPKTCINDDANNEEIQIVLTRTDTGAEITVSVTQYGKIDRQ